MADSAPTFSWADSWAGDKKPKEQMKQEILPGDVAQLLSAIRSAESYDTWLGRASGTDPYSVRNGSKEDEGITDMTVGELLKVLKKDDRASGAYQITYDTLDWLVNYSKMDVDSKDKFTPELQDRMAVRLLERRGLSDYLSGDIKPEEFAGRLAKEWAGLPKDDTGKTYWDGAKMAAAGLVGFNKAQISWDSFLEAMPNREDFSPQKVASGRTALIAGLPEYTTPDLATYANSGMLSEITDLPSRRGGSEILSEQQAISSRVDPTLPPLPPRGQAEPRLESELAATQMATQNGRFSGVSAPQRGQIPIPQPTQPAPAPEPPLRPESEPRLESELAATQMGAMNPQPSLREVTVPEREPVKMSAVQQMIAQGRTDEKTMSLARLLDKKIAERSAAQREQREEQQAKVRSLAGSRVMGGQSDRAAAGLERQRKDHGTVELIDKMIVAAEQQDRTDLIPVLSAKRRAILDRYEIKSELIGFKNAFQEGLTAGVAGDEFRAGARVYDETPDFQTPDKAAYEEALAMERALESEFAESNPVLDFTGRFLGSAIGFGKVASAVGWGKNAYQGLIRQGSVAGLETAIYGFMEGETLDERIDNAKLYGGIGTVFGGSIGMIGGKIAGNRARQSAAEKLQTEKDKLEKFGGWDHNGVVGEKGAYIEGTAKRLNSPLSDSNEVIRIVEQEMIEAGLKSAREKGPLSGYDYGIALKQALETTGISAQRLRHAEAEVGREIINFRNQTVKDLTVRASKLADETGFKNGSYQPGVFAKFYANRVGSLVRLASKSVSNAYGGAIQRTATAMAKQSAISDAALKSKAILLFQKNTVDDNVVKELTLNMSNIKKKDPGINRAERKAAYDELVEHLRRKYGQETVDGFEEMRAFIQSRAAARRKTVDSDMPEDEFYWPSQYTDKAKIPAVEGPRSGKRQTRYTQDQMRNQMEENDILLDNYANPTEAAAKTIRQWDAEIAAFDAMELANYAVQRRELAAQLANATSKAEARAIKAKANKLEASISNGTSLDKSLRESLKIQGAKKMDRAQASDIMTSLVDRGTQGPTGMIAELRKWGYLGTIGNPYSAILNLGDLTNSMVNFGVVNTAEAVLDGFRRSGLRVTVDDIGLAQQATGEYVKETPGQIGSRFANQAYRAVSDTGEFLGWQFSGFRKMDQIGKNVAMNAAIKQGRQRILKGDFDKVWGHAFTPRELKQLKADLRAGRKTDLVTDFAAVNLAKLQPTDLAQMPKWYLDNPNWRVLYMLRTFAIKQYDQIERLVIEDWKQGNKKQAVKNALAYMSIVGGGNTLLNEARQGFKVDGDPFGPDSNLAGRYGAWALGTGSLNLMNKYAFEQLQRGNADAVVLGVMPPAYTMLANPLADMARMTADENFQFAQDSKTLGMTPWGRLAQDWLGDDENDKLWEDL